MSVLDIGCGHGLFACLAAILRGPLEVTGIDVNQSALETARRVASQSEIRASQSKLRFAFAEQPENWPQEQFDAVCMVDVLHHVAPDEQKAFLLRAYERVKPGGKLVYKDMVSRPRWRALANRVHDLILARQWVHTVPAVQIWAWLEPFGARKLSEYRENRLWYGHEFLVVEKPAHQPDSMV